MTGGWAATNTLRERMSYPRPSYSAQGHYLGKTDVPKRLETDAIAALALVEAALDAAADYLHSDVIIDGHPYHGVSIYPELETGTTKLDALAAALRAVREGQ